VDKAIVSVIIPTLNAGPRLRTVVDALMGQSAPPAEIIVVDSSSDDGTAGLAREIGCRVISIDRKDFNHGTTRNLAEAAAVGDVLIFMTQDAEPADDRLIENLVLPLTEPLVAAAFARQITDERAGPVERFARGFNYPAESRIKCRDDLEELGIKTFFFSNVCSAIKKDVFNFMGGFPGTIMNEDMSFACKAIMGGYKIAYQADARVVHQHDYTPMEQLRRYFDIGVSLVENDIIGLAEPGGEGARFIKEGFSSLFSPSRPLVSVRFLADAAFRYAGFFLGMRYRSMPASMVGRLSMHRFYFDHTSGAADTTAMPDIKENLDDE
jgi:rhamnosyltransferase